MARKPFKLNKLDTRLPTTVISTAMLERLRSAAESQRVSQGRIVRDALDRYLLEIKQAA